MPPPKKLFLINCHVSMGVCLKQGCHYFGTFGPQKSPCPGKADASRSYEDQDELCAASRPCMIAKFHASGVYEDEVG